MSRMRIARAARLIRRGRWLLFAGMTIIQSEERRAGLARPNWGWRVPNVQRR